MYVSRHPGLDRSCYPTVQHFQIIRGCNVPSWSGQAHLKNKPPSAIRSYVFVFVICQIKINIHILYSQGCGFTAVCTSSHRDGNCLLE